MQTNLQIIKEMAIPFPYEKELNHIEVLVKAFPQNYDYPGGFNPRTVLDLQVAGFTKFVTSEFVNRFQYSASLSISKENTLDQPVRDQYFAIFYSGDIPEFALQKIALAKKTGLAYFTVHSNYPLPIKAIFQQVDPIVIGWKSNPRIRVGDWMHKTKRLKRPVLGVVIAVWDIDKELEFWK